MRAASRTTRVRFNLFTVEETALYRDRFMDDSILARAVASGPGPGIVTRCPPQVRLARPNPLGRGAESEVEPPRRRSAGFAPTPGHRSERSRIFSTGMAAKSGDSTVAPGEQSEA